MGIVIAHQPVAAPILAAAATGAAQAAERRRKLQAEMEIERQRLAAQSADRAADREMRAGAEFQRQHTFIPAAPAAPQAAPQQPPVDVGASIVPQIGGGPVVPFAPNAPVTVPFAPGQAPAPQQPPAAAPAIIPPMVQPPPGIPAVGPNGEPGYYVPKDWADTHELVDGQWRSKGDVQDERIRGRASYRHELELESSSLKEVQDAAAAIETQMNKLAAEGRLNPAGEKQWRDMAGDLARMRGADARGGNMRQFLSQWLEKYNAANPDSWVIDKATPQERLREDAIYYGPDGRELTKEQVQAGAPAAKMLVPTETGWQVIEIGKEQKDTTLEDYAKAEQAAIASLRARRGPADTTPLTEADIENEMKRQKEAAAKWGGKTEQGGATPPPAGGQAPPPAAPQVTVEQMQQDALNAAQQAGMPMATDPAMSGGTTNYTVDPATGERIVTSHTYTGTTASKKTQPDVKVAEDELKAAQNDLSSLTEQIGNYGNVEGKTKRLPSKKDKAALADLEAKRDEAMSRVEQAAVKVDIMNGKRPTAENVAMAHHIINELEAKYGPVQSLDEITDAQDRQQAQFAEEILKRARGG